jgi:hypothetical protein
MTGLTGERTVKMIKDRREKKEKGWNFFKNYSLYVTGDYFIPFTEADNEDGDKLICLKD